MPSDPDADRGTRHAHALTEFRDVSVCDLSGAERFVVWAIRWRCSAQDDPAFADECLSDSFRRAGLDGAQQALERFVCSTCPKRLSCPAVQRLGCRRLNALEAHALHAIACLQAGLIGEAWHTLRSVCPETQLQAALESLQDLGLALARSGGAIRRWSSATPPTRAPVSH
jgi:hypothetical protein